MYATSFIESGALLINLSTNFYQIHAKFHILCPVHQMKKNIRQLHLALLVSVFVLIFSTNFSMASPVRINSLKNLINKSLLPSSGRTSPSKSKSPKWINPCRLATHPLDPEKDFADAPVLPKSELYHNVMSRAKVARNHGQQILQAFLNSTFKDPQFENGVKSYRQEWLPKIPHSSEETFTQFNIMQSFTTSFEYLQYFAIGIEQILLDQILHDGSMIDNFKDIEYDLFQLMCELELAMHLENIQPKPDMLRHVMAHQYRDINEKSLRNLRDYLIMRDYISATNFIAHLFAYHKSRIISRNKV